MYVCYECFCEFLIFIIIELMNAFVILDRKKLFSKFELVTVSTVNISSLWRNISTEGATFRVTQQQTNSRKPAYITQQNTDRSIQYFCYVHLVLK